MTRRAQLVLVLGLVVGLLMVIVVWRATRDSDPGSRSPLSPLAPTASTRPLFPSPMRTPTATLFYSPLPVPPTALSPVTTATLEAIRAKRPTASSPSPSDNKMPYISPDTWRAWALRVLAAAAVLAMIGLRLRRN